MYAEGLAGRLFCCSNISRKWRVDGIRGNFPRILPWQPPCQRRASGEDRCGCAVAFTVACELRVI